MTVLATTCRLDSQRRLTVPRVPVPSIDWRVEMLEQFYANDRVWGVGDGGYPTKCRIRT